ncbi:hypothetical protein E4T39_02601 [Aureobasidium subglaciale]|nr:hypothetical protein E4T39_02601 [Aureobasidium subglaciale]
MQTGKETAQVHTVSLDSEERAFPDPQWQPGKRARFPWTGFTALMTVVFCAICSVIVLLLSDGKSTLRWPEKIAPSIILSGFNGVANICFGIAIANGVAITWWRMALKGATIQDLHRSWTFSASVKDIVLGGRYFNFIALAALAAKLTIIDSMLLQRAATRDTLPDPGRKTTVEVAVNSSMPYTASWANNSMTGDPETLEWFSKNWNYLSRSSGIYENSFVDCNGTCLFNVHGTGFEIDCSTETSAVDNGAAAVVDAIAAAKYKALNDSSAEYPEVTEQPSFEITFQALYGNTGIDGNYSTIVMNITTTAANQTSPTSCSGIMTRHVCILRPAVISYPVTVEDTFSSSPGPGESQTGRVSNMYLGRNATSFGGTLYYYDAENDWYDTTLRPYNKAAKQQDTFSVVRHKDILEEQGQPLTTIGGIAVALTDGFAGDAYLYYDTASDYYTMIPDGSAKNIFRASHNSTMTPFGCNYQYEDPLDELVSRINELMFSLAIDPWYVDLDLNSSDYTTWNATEYTHSIHYQTNRAYMWGALASMLFCIICVLPSYYGYWQLGREVTLGPFEIANAFRAPVLDHPAVANARVKDLIREVGNRQVKYGEMIRHDAPGRLAMAEPDARELGERISELMDGKVGWVCDWTASIIVQVTEARVMDAATKNDLEDMISEAERNVSTGDFARAEDIYRRILPIIQQHQGPEAASTELYNFSNVLIQQQKHSEAEPILRNLLVSLAQRPINGETNHFLEQEAGTIRMLSRSLAVQGKVDEVLQDDFKSDDEQMQARGTCYKSEVAWLISSVSAPDPCASAYLQSAQGERYYEFTALYNYSVGSAKNSVKQFELPNSVKCYGSAKDLAADPDVELVVCILSNKSHYKVLLPAIKAGKDVYTELHLASNMEQMKQLVDLAEQRGIRTMFGSQSQASPVVHLVKNLIAKGKIGKPLGTTGIEPLGTTGISLDKPLPTSFRMLAERKAGANFSTIWFLHSITCLFEAFGELKTYDSILGIDYPTLELMDPSQGGKIVDSVRKDCPDNIRLQDRFESGALVTYQLRAGEAFLGEPDCRWLINGDEGDISITNPRGCFDIEHEGIEIKYRKAGEKEAQKIELPQDDLTELKHPAQNVGRLYEAFVKGETGSYADWNVALKRHAFIDEMFQRAEGDKAFGEPAVYRSK